MKKENEARDKWEKTHLCGNIYNNNHCEYLLYNEEKDKVLNGKKLDLYGIYCTCENKVRKISSGSDWTGLSPKFCPKRNSLSESVPEFTADIYDTSKTEVFEVKENGKFKGVLIDIPIIAADDIRKRLADNGLSPKNEDETEIWFNTDKEKWNIFYIPDKYGNKGNMIKASEFLTDTEMETIRQMIEELPLSSGESTTYVPALHHQRRIRGRFREFYVRCIHSLCLRCLYSFSP